MSVRRERELGYQQEAAARVPQRQIHPAPRVGKDPVAQEPFEQPVRRAFVVASPHTHEYQQSGCDGSDEPTIDADRRFRDALNQTDHDVLHPWITGASVMMPAPMSKGAGDGICQGESVRFGAVLHGWSKVMAMAGFVVRSLVRLSALVAMVVCGSLAARTASAQDQPLQGDARHGKAISYTCLGCHGIEGYKNAYPNYSVPKLEGQNPEYLAAALHGYKSGDRSHITMHSQASNLSDQDIADIAAYFAGKPLVSEHKPVGTPPAAAALCVSCHGQDGVTIAPMYPSLAGQHSDYIVRALAEYQKGGRKNPIMSGFVTTLKDSDFEAIAAYFSKQRPSLSTESRPYTRLTVDNSRE